MSNTMFRSPLQEVALFLRWLPAHYDVSNDGDGENVRHFSGVSVEVRELQG